MIKEFCSYAFCEALDPDCENYVDELGQGTVDWQLILTDLK